jgi:radical SAM protein with 4Fe4S-binding SPASM domain
VQCIKYELFDKGYNINSGELLGLNPYTCLADNGRYLLIKPNGEIAFCSEDFNVQRYGSIFYAPTKIIPPKLYENTIEKGYICSDCPLYPSCYPSKLCPACKHPICDEMQKNAILADLGLSIRKEYRKFLKTNML